MHYVRMQGAPGAGKSSPQEFLLVHGLGASLGFWYLRLAPALVNRHWSVTMFDLRGHGLSSTPLSGYSPDILARDLEALLDNLGIASVHVVGHSFGGCVGLHFACRHPQRVRSLVLADVRLRAIQPRLNLRGWRAWPRYRAALAYAGLRVNEDTFDFDFRFLGDLADLTLKNPRAADRLQRLVPSPFAGRSGRAAARRWTDLLNRTSARNEIQYGERLSRGQLASLKTATLLVYGELSQALPTGIALSKQWPHARFEVAPGAGHFFPMNSPRKLLEPIERFLGEMT